MFLANIDNRKYVSIVRKDDIRVFESMMWRMYCGETFSTRSPFIVSNLLLDEVDEFSEFVSALILRDSVEVEAGNTLLVPQNPSHEVTLDYMQRALQDVVTFLMNQNLPFVYISYHEQGVMKRWVRMPQREVW